jgi:hypothetical protein
MRNALLTVWNAFCAKQVRYNLKTFGITEALNALITLTRCAMLSGFSAISASVIHWSGAPIHQNHFYEVLTGTAAHRQKALTGMARSQAAEKQFLLCLFS